MSKFTVGDVVRHKADQARLVIVSVEDTGLFSENLTGWYWVRRRAHRDQFRLHECELTTLEEQIVN